MPSFLKVAARNSPLSRAQVEEVQKTYNLILEPIYVETYGDKDRTTSLRTLDKTDFFTREVDELVLQKKCRISIHSAKDLPDPLSAGLKLVVLTQGLDPSDSLVFREPVKVVATSSVRREECVRQLFPNCSFVDLRGTIHERLAKMERGEVDGVVIAEAALIRLGLTYLPRIKLPGETVPLQGRLAIVARADDEEIYDYFISRS